MNCESKTNGSQWCWPPKDGGEMILVQTEQNIMYKVVKTIIALHKKIMKRHNKDQSFFTFDFRFVPGIRSKWSSEILLLLLYQLVQYVMCTGILFLVPSNIEYTLGEQRG